jgi:hypothetical protein
MYEPKLQLAKLLIRKQNTKEEGEQLLRDIIDDYSAGESSSMTIVLAAYEEIMNTKNASMIEQYFVERFDEFSEALQIMALEKFDQPYRVLARVSKVYTYKYPEQLRNLVESIPFPSPGEIGKQYAFEIAEIYKECGKSILWESNVSDDLEVAKTYFEQAEIFYGIDANATSPYQLIMHAENLNKLKEYDKAIELLCHDEKFVNEGNKTFREYRYAEALYGLGDGHYEQALEHINNASESKNAEKYWAAFEELKARILFKMDPEGDEWRRCFEAAINNADNEKYKKSLQGKYQEHVSKII